MKIFFKLLMVGILLDLCINAAGQEFRIKAGFNMSTMSFKEDEISLPYNTSGISKSKYQMYPGFHIGGLLEIPVLNPVSLETGLLVSSQGSRVEYDDLFIGTSNIHQSDNFNIYYLDILLRAIIPFKLNKFNFYAAAGSYFGYGISGNISSKSIYENLSETEKASIKWGSGLQDDLRSFDYGISVEAGVKLNQHFNVGLLYNPGLENISPKRAYGSGINNSLYGITIAYMIGNAKSSEAKRTIRTEKIRTGNNKNSASEADIQKRDGIRSDSINAIRLEQERMISQKARADSIESAKKEAALNEIRLKKIEENKADSLKSAKEITVNTKDVIVYRVQFASSTAKKGSYEIKIAGKNYNTWEYFYNGAHRSTAGEFKTLSSAVEFQNLMRKSGYTQAFVVAFKNNIRSTDPSLFK